MSALLMLSIWWHALLGFLTLGWVLLCYSLGFREWLSKKIHRKWLKDAWLRQHFGEEGRRRWLLSKVLWAEWARYNTAKERIFWLSKVGATPGVAMKKALMKAEAVVARSRLLYGKGCFDAAHRTADGRCEGLVGVPEIAACTTPPWGEWWRPYAARHHADPSDHVCRPCYEKDGVSDMRHGEPTALDWFAAGFWDPVTREDGVVVNPMAIFDRDVFRAAWNGDGLPNAPFNDGGAYLKKADALVRSEEIRTGRIAPGICRLNGIG